MFRIRSTSKTTFKAPFISAIIIAGLQALPSQAAIEMLDRIVAIVDSQAITQTELDRRKDDITSRARESGVQLPDDSVITQQTINQLINETLQLGLARRYGVRATDQEVTETITRIAGQAGMPLDQFLNRVETSIGLPLNEYRETIRRQLTLQQISQGVVASRIQVSDQDIDSFLKSADAKFWSSADYHVGHIFIPVSQSSTFEEAQQAEKDAQSIYTRLLQGANFEATAIAESKGPAALNGGDLGWRKTSTLPSIFADLVPKLDVGQVSKPMRSQAGYHILKLKDKRGDDKQVITQSNVSHILLKTNEIRDDQEAQRQLREFKQQVIAGDATFEDIAKEHTDDIGSKLSGGNMGWSSRGVFVPEFEKVMLEIAEGEISEPFKTQFGWHILTVSERREEDVTEDVLRNRARNVIRSRRFEDELQLWVQEMRDNAFIDIRI